MESLKAALLTVGCVVLPIVALITYIVIFMVVDEIVGILKTYARTWKRN